MSRHRHRRGWLKIRRRRPAWSLELAWWCLEEGNSRGAGANGLDEASGAVTGPLAIGSHRHDTEGMFGPKVRWAGPVVINTKTKYFGIRPCWSSR